MYRLTFLVFFVLRVFIVLAQSVPREMVVVEVGTATTCTYCPGASMGVDDLLANGKFVAVIENHDNDAYSNIFSDARNILYAVPGLPATSMDGWQAYVGGDHYVSVYPVFLPMYNTCIAENSPVSMEMEVTNSGLYYTATITLTRVGTLPDATLALQFIVTQSHISQAWQGQTHLEHVNRLMAPDQNGTPISFAGGDVQTVTLQFSLDSAWPAADCEFVAFLQNTKNGQGIQAGSNAFGMKRYDILQGIKRGAVDLTPGFTTLANVISKGDVVTFTNTTHGGYIGVPEFYKWHFPGATPDTSSMKNPTVTYNECGLHDVTLIVWRGGQVDTLTEAGFIQVGPPVNVVATPGDTACWDQTIILDASTPGATSYLWQPGGETTPSIAVNYAQYGLGMHNFTVTVNADGCEQTKQTSAYLDACTRIHETEIAADVSVYPNPNNGNFTLELRSGKSFTADVSITNNLGLSVWQRNNVNVTGGKVENLMIPGLNPGLYLMLLRSTGLIITKKILVR